MLGHLGINSAVDSLEMILQSLCDELILKGKIGVIQSKEFIIAEVRLRGMLDRVIWVGELLIVILVEFVDGWRNEEDRFGCYLQFLLHQIL